MLTRTLARGIWRYWGYLLLVLIIGAWSKAWELTPRLLLLFSLADMLYFLFLAPAWCCAVNRDGTLCRENSAGLLLGCYRRQHKFQRLKMVVVGHTWRQATRGLWVTPKQTLATLGAVAGIISSIASVVGLLVHR
jgi:hypothetical protein